MPKVSIIVPVYNKEEYITATLDSVLNQSFEDYEVIIVDDGSTDKTLEKIKEYTDKDNRFHLIHIPNGGVSHARNVGINHAKGKWLQFLDGDDLIDREYLFAAVNMVEECGADIIFTDFCMIDESGQCLKTVKSQEYGLIDQAGLCRIFIEKQYHNGFFGYISNKLLKKTLLEKSKAKFNERIKLAEDLDFYSQLYCAVEKACFACINSFYYLQTESNYLNNTSVDYLSQIKVHLDIRKWFIHSGKYEEYRDVLDRKVSEYVYFALFHANEKKEDLKEYYEKIIADPEITECIDFTGFQGFEKKILKAVKRNRYNKICRLIKERTAIRSIYRGIKGHE